MNVTVTVPAGAFAVPTLVQLSATAPSDFAGIPNLAAELLNGSIRIDFDGVAQKPLQLSIPVADASPSKSYFLGHSTRGPSIEIVDTLSLAGGGLTTALGSASTPLRINTRDWGAFGSHRWRSSPS